MIVLEIHLSIVFAEVVPVITQNSLTRLFCQGNSLEAGTAIDEEIPGTTKEFKTFYIVNFFTPSKNKWITSF
jgi:hypothetical protein